MGVMYWIAYGLAMIFVAATVGLVLLAAIGLIGAITYLLRFYKVRHDRQHLTLLFFAPAVLSVASFVFYKIAEEGGPSFGRWLTTTASYENADNAIVAILLGLLSIAAGLFGCLGWLYPMKAAWDGDADSIVVYPVALAWAFVGGSSLLAYAMTTPWSS